MSEVWMIRVQGYGTFEFSGTEEEAEKTRAHKAGHEGGVGMKWRKSLARTSDRIAAQIAEIFDRGEGIPASLLRKRSAALKAESKESAKGGVEFPCTDCNGDAGVGYSANKKSDWGGKVKPGERLCTRCFQKRGGINFFGKS